ncbi:MAG TPA: FISUMP domain-containing protein [Prolixibacteraceae bacterium]|nr:FISUMP domain-containing protein [Prolixibacteraceae bacterium]
MSTIVLITFASGCKKDENHPLIITEEAFNIGSVTAISGGTIEWEDALAITGRGICWNTEVNPTIEDHKTSNGKGTGNFTNTLTGLLPNTSYFIRSYVIKNGRVLYGNLVSFKTNDLITDIDGNTYNTITIGNQEWMAENLRTTRFANGDPIATTTPATLPIMYYTDPVYQWAYDGLEKNATKYGRLYTWYAVMDRRRLCPDGWHIPSDAEWTELENYLISNRYNYDGTNSRNKVALALASTKGWSYCESSGSPGNNSYADNRDKTGFTALPAGYRNHEGKFIDLGNSSCFWSSSEAFTYNAYYRYIRSTNKEFVRSSYYEFCAVSVRCIKD